MSISMSYFDASRETSPDPIVLPSSPLSGRKLRSTRKTRQSTPRRSRLSRQISRMTPSKEIILDTPQLGANNRGSPWRIKVTVQAEQRDNSPGKMVTRTTSIPLRSPSRKRSASPEKKKRGQAVVEEDHGDIKKAGRKRRGTPIREKRSAPQLRAEQSTEQAPQPEHELEQEYDVFAAATAIEAEQAMQAMTSVSHTPAQNRRASGRLARLSAQWSNGTGRTKRLSRAREELDEALQDAVGDGDMTLSRAEDFTMVSLESLQTTKEASLLHNSQLSRSHLSTVREADVEKSALSVSYLSSSPPSTDDVQYPDLSAAKAQTTILSPWQPSIQRLSAQASLQSPFEPTSSAKKRKSGWRQDVNAMSQKPTLLAGMRSSSSLLHAKQPAQVEESLRDRYNAHQRERVWQIERKAVSQKIQQASPEKVITVEDDMHMSDASGAVEDEEPEPEREAEHDDEGDLWQTEASRQIQEDIHRRPDARRTNSTEDRPYDSQKSERVEDLFAHLPMKPARPKIPRTWRRSSGMDFSYVDSPAHLPVVELTTDRRQSTDGSGVLTPPSTDRSEGESVDKHVGAIELQGEADHQLHSEFTQPETEGTRYQDEDEEMLDDHDDDEAQSGDDVQQDAEDECSDEDAMVEDRNEAPRSNSSVDEGFVPRRNDSNNARSTLPPSAGGTRYSQSRGNARSIMGGPLSGDVRDEPEKHPHTGRRGPQPESPQDTDSGSGDFFQSNMPQMFKTDKGKPRRRPPRRPTTDLTELLGLESSPAKPAPRNIRVSEIGRPAQHLRSRPSSQQRKSSPLSARHINRISKESPSGGAKEKALNSPLRKSLLNSSRLLATAPKFGDDDKPAMTVELQKPDASSKEAFLSPPKLTHDPITGQPLAQPKRRGRRKRLRGGDNTESTVTDSFASGDSRRENVQAQKALGQSHIDTTLTDSFASKASDQRQLLQESAVKRKDQHQRRQAEAQPHAVGAYSISRPSTGIGHRDYVQAQQTQSRVHVTYPDDENEDEDQQGEHQEHLTGHRRAVSVLDSNVEIPVHEITPDRAGEASYEQDEHSYEEGSISQPVYHRSYEENLNLDSPTKIKVNFNDATSFSKDVDQTSWLAEARRRPALFDTSAPVQNSAQPHSDNGFRPTPLERPEMTLVNKKPLQLPGTGLISKLSTTFWNAVVRPACPAEIESETKSQTLAPRQNVDDSFTITIRSQLRSRYGVLSESFPWTMSHQRTLHRMLNSVSSRRPDTLIPRKGNLPKALAKNINEICTSITGYRWLLTRDHAYVVHSFMHTLVPTATIEAIKSGEVAFIGDETARRIRGYFDPQRHGDDPVWSTARGAHAHVVEFVNSHRGYLTVQFVLAALGDCVLSNDVLKRKLEREGRGEEFERRAFGIEVRV